MSVDFAYGFSTRLGQQQYAERIAGMVRADDHDMAIREILHHIARYPSAITEEAVYTDRDHVVVVGWEELNTALERHRSHGRPCTAVGATLSSAASGATSFDGWVEPLVACGFYTDSPYVFSGVRQEVLRAASAKAPPPWQGSMEYAGGLLELSGLAKLHRARLNHSPKLWPEPGDGDRRAPSEVVAYVLGGLLEQVLFHRAIKRGLDANGLISRMPLLVDSGDAQMPIRSVYYTTTICKDAWKAHQREVARKASSRAQYEAYTLEQIDLLRKRRKMIRDWDAPAGAGYRESYLDFAAKHEERLLSTHRLFPGAYTWDLEDEEFEALLLAFHSARDPDYERPKSRAERIMGFWERLRTFALSRQD